MNKFTQGLVIFTCLALLAGGAGAAWVFRDKLVSTPKTGTPSVEYAALVQTLGGDEAGVRDELNELICTSSAKMSDADLRKAQALTSDCLDPRTLLDIEHVNTFLAKHADGMAYHFVSEEQRQMLRQYAGDRPSPAKVISMRKSLHVLAREFAALREPPEFKLTVEGDSPPAMPFLAMLRDSHQFMPGREPLIRENPRIPAFTSAEAELLSQLEQYFNSPLLAKAFPIAKYPKLYRNGRMPALPMNLPEYQQQIGEAVLGEKRLILPGEKPDPESAEAVDEVYSKLERFFSAIIGFEKS